MVRNPTAHSGSNSTAIAIATMPFSPLVAVPASTMPIIQTLLMVSYLKLAPQVRVYSENGHRRH